MDDNNNKVVWQAGPSQVINFGVYSSTALTIILLIAWQAGLVKSLLGDFLPVGEFLYIIKLVVIIMIGVSVWKWLEVKCIKYTLTEQVFRFQYGILNRVTQEFELYRVKDTTTIQPFFLRIFGLGNIRIDTTDNTTPVVYVLAINDTDKIRQIIRSGVEEMRRRRGIVEVANM